MGFIAFQLQAPATARYNRAVAGFIGHGMFSRAVKQEKQAHDKNYGLLQWLPLPTVFIP